MAYPFTLDDVRFLASPAGRDALDAAGGLPLTEASLLTDLTRLRRTVGDRSAAVAETIRLRRRAVGKLGDTGGRWLFTDESLQQASPAIVSAHRAGRVTGLGVHDLTCSIGTDVAFLAAVCPIVVGSDLDPVRLLMARHNLTESGVPPRLVLADALTRSTRGLLGYADPARRDRTGRRITSVSTVPTVAELDAAHAYRPPVLRLPPGVDYDELNRPGEIEIVSLDGAAREAVLWPAELATTRRRATVLTSGSHPISGNGAARYELTSDDPDEASVGPIAQWLVDPDPAVVRAHLVRQYAARHGLVRLDPHLAYLTGPHPPPGIRAFQVLDAAPYRERTVADWARRDGIGTLEIKQRGTPVIPDELRARLRPALRGPRSIAATLVIARVGSQPQAFWCRAVDPR
ncbi:MAG TPA: class I SAM-dependent methyltransferase [Nakamurella sp.]|nr:class I SAM-dependent methyltransferase [Nakamurella sp.]